MKDLYIGVLFERGRCEV